MADLPGGRVEESWSDKKAGEADAVEPGTDSMPLVGGKEVEDRSTHQAGKDP